MSLNGQWSIVALVFGIEGQSAVGRRIATLGVSGSRIICRIFRVHRVGTVYLGGTTLGTTTPIAFVV